MSLSLPSLLDSLVPTNFPQRFAKKKRHLVHRYIMENDWIQQQTLNNFSTSKDSLEEWNFQTCFIFGLLTKSDLAGLATLCSVKHKGIIKLCTALAENTSFDAMFLPPADLINKLQG